MDVIPYELLVEIFRALTIIDRPFTRPPGPDWPYKEDQSRRRIRSAAECMNEGHPALGWINITFVCHMWRECALQNASLWTYLPDAVVLGPRWLDLFIDRGGEAGVYYDDMDLTALKLEGHGLLSGHIHHIGVLHLVYNPNRSSMYHDLLQQPMPLVTELSLQNFDLSVVRADLPRLRRLRLWDTNFRAHYPPQVFTSEITSFDYYTGPTPKMDEWGVPNKRPVNLSAVFDALQKMPRLRSLSLKLDAIEDDSEQELPLVELHSLTRADFSGESSILHPALRRITFPPSASVRIVPRAAGIYTGGFEADKRSNPAFVQYCEDLVRNSGLAPFCTVEVNVKMYTLYFAAARHRLPDVSLAKPAYDLELELPVVNNSAARELVSKIVGQLCKKECLRELYVSGGWDEASSAFFHDMPEVLHLDLMGPVVRLLVHYLTDRVQPCTSPDANSEKRLGDRLETLSLHRGHLDQDQCQELAMRIKSSHVRSQERRVNCYISKANLALLGGDVWDEACIKVTGV